MHASADNMPNQHAEPVRDKEEQCLRTRTNILRTQSFHSNHTTHEKERIANAVQCLRTTNNQPHRLTNSEDGVPNGPRKDTQER